MPVGPAARVRCSQIELPETGSSVTTASWSSEPVLQGSCYWRLFDEFNASIFTHWTYSIESALHEHLLQSPDLRLWSS